LTNKKCSKCGEEKALEEFYNKESNLKTRKDSHCKVCNQEAQAKWRSSNKDRQWKTNLMHKYGITTEQYKEMFEKQEGCCAICDRHQDEFKIRLAVDHNHATREIRGLLCAYCNHRLIGRHRDGTKLRKMADYVDGGTGWFVPPKKRTVKRKPR
jgi:hypothetical protein